MPAIGEDDVFDGVEITVGGAVDEDGAGSGATAQPAGSLTAGSGDELDDESLVDDGDEEDEDDIGE